jgi:catechol 2,3-dioxygenase-like lactoylglutathione lyase family enzyme
MTPLAAPHPLASAWKIIPHFPSRSIPATIAFYTSVLGFSVGGTYVHDDHPLAGAGDPTFVSLYAGDKAAANIYFFLTVEGKDRERTMGEGKVMIALKEGEVDVLYEKLKGLQEERSKSRGEGEGGGEGEWGIVDEIGDRPWGYRDFSVRDEDGNQLSFFCFLENGEDEENEDGEKEKVDA